MEDSRLEAIERLRLAARQVEAVADEAAAGRGQREDLDLAMAEVVGAQRQLYGQRPRAKRGEGGLHRLLTYLRAHVGEEVSGEELRFVSGIQEWARRVRELRDERGYDISELGGSMYRLERVDPDRGRAAEWQLANSIRRSGGSAMSRIEKFLTAKVGEVVTRAQVDYVAEPAKEGSRRLRQLRDEFGWPVNSYIDEPGLRPGEYRLVSDDPNDRRDTRQRLYEEGVRERVYSRDNYTCQVCGRNREKALAAGDTRFYLELHHKSAVAEELDRLPPDELNNEENLVTLCHSDHIKETAKLQERRRRERRAR